MENDYSEFENSKKHQQVKYLYQFKEEIVDQLNYQTRKNFLKKMCDLDLLLFSIGCAHKKFDHIAPDLSFFGNEYLWGEISKRTEKMEREKPELVNSIRLWHREKFAKILSDYSCINETLAKKNEFYFEAKKLFKDKF